MHLSLFAAKQHDGFTFCLYFPFRDLFAWVKVSAFQSSIKSASLKRGGPERINFMFGDVEMYFGHTSDTQLK